MVINNSFSIINNFLHKIHIFFLVSNVTSKQLQGIYTFSVMRSTLTPSDVEGENFCEYI